MSEFKLRPRRPSAKTQQQGDNRAWSKAFQGLMRIVRMTSSSSRKGGARRAPSPRMQRCAIRVTYSPNRVRGQWAAHGRYIEREGGLTEGIAAKLASWQKAGDERMFKIIVSPEFGERIDLDRLARDLMTRVSGELGVPLEWAAAAHRNTDHPHLHIALRGSAGLRLPRDYVKHGLRRAAEALCTAQLGYRTELDIRESERREVTAQHVTSLDRRLARLQPGAKLTPILAARLRTLERMGLARFDQAVDWEVRPNFVATLSAAQRANDKQRSLFADQKNRSAATRTVEPEGSRVHNSRTR